MSGAGEEFMTKWKSVAATGVTAAALVFGALVPPAMAQSTKVPYDAAPTGTAPQGSTAPFDSVGDHNPRASGASSDDMREMPISDLLNLLSAQGYARYHNIQRFGDIYLVEAMTTEFRNVTLEVDTATGAIRER